MNQIGLVVLLLVRLTTVLLNDDNLSDFPQKMLVQHNKYRLLHNSHAMTLSTSLNAFAQEWADYLAMNNLFKHRKNLFSLNRGENIYYSYDSVLLPSGMDAADSWYNEISDWSFANNSPKSPNAVTAHFTQMVWNSSLQLGCGHSYNGNKVYVVCNYFIAGNMLEEYEQNVFEPSL
ncbi:uncharacterized protein LOC100213516 [Hydra vulgaris]|uniref:Uncharacterized protein LOC100213516 n=1 Tax=Hydra vulgaris TaxID=6087 RepID=A0ABM4BU90_HYDVU